MANNKNIKKWVLLLFSSMFIVSFFTQFWGNLFFLTIESAYFIPKQSSIFTFNATEYNTGSSDTWVYGEDFRSYYFNRNDGNETVFFISRKEAQSCPDFDPLQYGTWCNRHSSE